jgi:hypothetical protein
MCLKGAMITGEKMSDPLFLEMARGLVAYMFQEENFPLVLSIDARLVLQMLYKMANGRLGRLMIGKPNLFKINCSSGG